MRSFFILFLFRQDSVYLFYSITIRANSLTYDVIYAFTKRNEFQCKKHFQSLFDRHTEWESVKGNLLYCMKFISTIFSLSSFRHFQQQQQQHQQNKNEKENDYLWSLWSIQTMENGIKQTPDCYGFHIRFTGSEFYCTTCDFHPGWLAGAGWLVCMCVCCALNGFWTLMLVIVFSTSEPLANSISRHFHKRSNFSSFFFSLPNAVHLLDLPFCIAFHLIVMRRLVKIHRLWKKREHNSC